MIEFDEARHIYTVDGKTVPSVTHITRFLSVDLMTANTWARDAAADRGTRVHAITACIDYGEMPEVEEDIAGYVDAYLRFLADYSVEWDGIERIVYCEEFGYAGTCDRFGRVDGVPTVLDIKTSAALRVPQVSAQCAAYERALWWADNATRRLSALRLARDGTYEYRALDKSTGWELFRACLTIQHHIKGRLS